MIGRELLQAAQQLPTRSEQLPPTKPASIALSSIRKKRMTIAAPAKQTPTICVCVSRSRKTAIAKPTVTIGYNAVTVVITAVLPPL